jgi:uncharacterized membrane protein required for colicin V production
MATVIVLAIILACVVQQVFFGSLVRSFAMLISAVLGLLVAFNFFEPLAQVLINSDIIPWKAHGAAMALLFVICFGVLLTVAIKLLGRDVAFSPVVDRAGGAVIGLGTGMVISGVLLVAIGLLSGSAAFPYERFQAAGPEVERPKRAFLNADGFAAGLFGLVSDGSLAGSSSFAMLHASFTDAIAIDRLAAAKKISPLAGKNAVQPPVVIWPAPLNITDSEGKKLAERPGSELMLVRVNMTRNAIGKDSPDFLLGQMRMICRSKEAKGAPTSGSGSAIFPVGYMKSPTALRREPATAVLPPAETKIEGSKPVDFAFYVPSGMKPALIEFKRNLVLPAPPVTDAKEAPEAVGFGDAGAGKKESASPAASGGNDRTARSSRPSPAPADANEE